MQPVEPTGNQEEHTGKERELALLRKFFESNVWKVCLLYGAPSSGKTYLLRILEKETQEKGDSAWEYYYGYQVRGDHLLDQIAGKHKPPIKRIVIIDEVDGISHYNPQTFEKVSKVIDQLPITTKVILTTAKPERMTESVMRLPQVFVEVAHPNEKERTRFIREQLMGEYTTHLSQDQPLIAKLADLSRRLNHGEIKAPIRDGIFCPIRRLTAGKLRKVFSKTNQQSWKVVSRDQNIPGAEYATHAEIPDPNLIERADLIATREDMITAFTKFCGYDTDTLFGTFTESIKMRNPLVL